MKSLSGEEEAKIEENMMAHKDPTNGELQNQNRIICHAVFGDDGLRDLAKKAEREPDQADAEQTIAKPDEDDATTEGPSGPGVM